MRRPPHLAARSVVVDGATSLGKTLDTAAANKSTLASGLLAAGALLSVLLPMSRAVPSGLGRHCACAPLLRGQGRAGRRAACPR